MRWILHSSSKTLNFLLLHRLWFLNMFLSFRRCMTWRHNRFFGGSQLCTHLSDIHGLPIVYERCSIDSGALCGFYDRSAVLVVNAFVSLIASTSWYEGEVIWFIPSPLASVDENPPIHLFICERKKTFNAVSKRKFYTYDLRKSSFIKELGY